MNKNNFIFIPKFILIFISAEIIFDQLAYPEEFMPFQTIGYWAKLGVADWLPKYYYAKAAIK